MRVAIIGAGWAGLAAAVEATARGHAVTLFERAPAAGGRARRVHWSVGAHRLPIDNGQHILIGAYRDTLALMRRCGVPVEAVLERRALSIEYADGPTIRAPRWPAPLHLAAAIAGARGLAWRARWQALRFSAWARAAGWRLDKDCTVEALLRARGVGAEAVALLWSPLCLAALNTPVERASAQVFLNVLRDSVGSGSRADSDLLLPRADLSTLLPDAACDWLARRGAHLRLGGAGTIDAIAPVAGGGWRVAAGRASQDVRTPAEGAREAFDAVVIATGPRAAAGLLESALAGAHDQAGAADGAAGRHARESLRALRALEPSAIATAWLLLPDGPHWKQPMYALRADRPASPAQWLFARQVLPGAAAGRGARAGLDASGSGEPTGQATGGSADGAVRTGAGGRHGAGLRLVAAVLSAHAADSAGRDALGASVLAQIGRELAGLTGISPARLAPADSPARIVVEKDATFLCTPGLRRPAVPTGLPGLWLAGDYTDSPYPGTLESAVRSGLQVARALGAANAHAPAADHVRAADRAHAAG